ncbi:hypothetical protein SCYAM73S_07459 [Streptomyces cyaneofuscatus]
MLWNALVLDRFTSLYQIVAFYQGKIAAAKFFAANILPGVCERALAENVDNSLMELDEAAFLKELLACFVNTRRHPEFVRVAALSYQLGTLSARARIPSMGGTMTAEAQSEASRRAR